MNPHHLHKKPGIAMHALVTSDSKTLATIPAPNFQLSHKVPLPLKDINIIHTYEDLRDLGAWFTL